MFQRLLLAIDGSPSGQTAVSFTCGLVAGTGAEVRVLHVSQHQSRSRGLPITTAQEADRIVTGAVLELLLAGVAVSGHVCVASCCTIADRIAAEAVAWRADAIVAGSRRRRGWRRLGSHGVRDAVTRQTGLPVLTAPAPLEVSAIEPGRGRRAHSSV